MFHPRLPIAGDGLLIPTFDFRDGTVRGIKDLAATPVRSRRSRTRKVVRQQTIIVHAEIAFIIQSVGTSVAARIHPDMPAGKVPAGHV